MKNTLTIIGAIAVAVAAIAAIAIFVKKYTVKLSVTKNQPDELPEEDDILEFGEDINWEEVPVEDDDEDDILAESIDELDNLDLDTEI